MHQESQIVFTPGPTINFRSTRKLSSYLVRAKLYTYLVRGKLYSFEWTIGSYKRNGTRCEVCENVTETETFTSTMTQNTYKKNINVTAPKNTS